MESSTTRAGKVSISHGKRNPIEWCRLLVCIVVLTACDPDARAAPRSQRSVVDVILTVHNQSRRAIHVTLASDSLQQTLGDIPSTASRSFSVPSALVGSPSMLRFEAVGDGGVPVRSDAFQVRRGEMVVWSFSGTGRGTLDRR